MSQVQKMTGSIAVLVEMANGNGDIDNGEPRLRPDKRGWISPMCLKRQPRDFLENHDDPAFKVIAKQCGIPPSELHIFESRKKGFGDMSDSDACKEALKLVAADEMKALKRYYDMRTFGCTCLEETDDSSDKKVHFVRTGCIQFSPLTSIAPVELVIGGLSKKATLRENIGQDLGPNAIKLVQHGLYFGCFFISPSEAFKTRATGKDIDLLLFLIPHFFSRRGAQRARVHVVSSIVGTHTNPLGSFNENHFIESCTPTLKDPEKIPVGMSDYNMPSVVSIQKAMKGMGEFSKISELCQNGN